MKKTRGLLFLDLFLTSFEIGFLSTSFHVAAKAEAIDDISYVEFDDDGIFRLGYYPQDVVSNISAEEIMANGDLKQTSLGDRYYIYQSRKFAIIETATIDTEGPYGFRFSNWDLVDDYNNRNNVVVEFKDVEWQLLKKAKTKTLPVLSPRIFWIERYSTLRFLPISLTIIRLYLTISINLSKKWPSLTKIANILPMGLRV